MGRVRMPKEVGRRFWRLIAEGATTEQAATGVGVSVSAGRLWFRDGGGMPPLTLAEPTARFLTLAEREAMDLCWAEGWTKADIARLLGRHPSTIGRELGRNRAPYPKLPPLPDGRRRRMGPQPGSLGPGRRPRPRYRASVAQAKAEQRARRPKPSKLAGQPAAAGAWVQDKLERRWSPEQIAGRLVEAFPDDESHAHLATRRSTRRSTSRAAARCAGS